MFVSLSVCPFVCSSCIWTRYDQMQWNFAHNTLSTRGRSGRDFRSRKWGFGVVFHKFSGKPYEIFFDFSKNFKIFSISVLHSSRFYLFKLSFSQEPHFDPKLSLPRYLIYIYNEESLSVCLFFMHLDIARANAMKFCTEYSFVLSKVMTRLWESEVGFLGGFYPVFWKTIRNFLRFFKNFSRFSRFLDYSLPTFTSLCCPWVKNSFLIENLHSEGIS